MDVSSIVNFNSNEPKFYLVEMKFNSYRIIQHYYNNIFAFQMHTFIIFALILNTFNTAIH